MCHYLFCFSTFVKALDRKKAETVLHMQSQSKGRHPSDALGQERETNRRHLRKPVEFKMLLRPILLHVDRYSEYISDRDTEPSGYVSKCAFSL